MDNQENKKEFEVTITETLEMTVTVTAADQSEAEGMVEDGWLGNEYTLYAEHFVRADFNAVPVEQAPDKGDVS